MSLEDRLDPRLSDPGSPGIADRWKQVRRERDAEVFDSVADQIEAGLLRIRGTDPDAVKERLRTRADGVREGTDRLRRKTVRTSQEDDVGDE